MHLQLSKQKQLKYCDFVCMEDKQKSKQNEQISAENPLNVICPVCGLNTAAILDPKQISDKKSLHLCLVCGYVFEYINPAN